MRLLLDKAWNSLLNSLMQILGAARIVEDLNQKILFQQQIILYRNSIFIFLFANCL